MQDIAESKVVLHREDVPIYRQAEWGDEGTHELALRSDIYAAMGSPKKITVTIERGDTLNNPAELAALIDTVNLTQVGWITDQSEGSVGGTIASLADLDWLNDPRAEGWRPIYERGAAQASGRPVVGDGPLSRAILGRLADKDEAAAGDQETP